jgi:hypothetical protein
MHLPAQNVSLERLLISVLPAYTTESEKGLWNKKGNGDRKQKRRRKSHNLKKKSIEEKKLKNER